MRRKLSFLFPLLIFGFLVDICAVRANPDPPAATSMERVVTLTNGAMYRGELLEYVPQSHVLLRLAGGELKRFDWRQIKDASAIAAPTEPASAPTSTKIAASTPPAAPVPGPKLAADAAGPPHDPIAYQRHLKAGESAFRAGAYRAAILDFKAAYRLNPDPNLHYSLARSYHNLGAYADAKEHYESFLEDGKDLGGSSRQEAKAQLLRAERAEKAIEALPPQLRARAPNEASFVSLSSTRPDVRLQRLAVHLEDTSGWGPAATGYWGPAEFKAWRSICKPPCERLVTTAGTFRVVGESTVSSEEFKLPGHTRDVSIDVSRGSRAMRVGAAVMLSFGGAFLVAGAATGLVTLNMHGHDCTFDSFVGYICPNRETPEMRTLRTDRERSTLLGATGGLLGGGAALIVASIPLFYFSKTRVTVH